MSLSTGQRLILLAFCVSLAAVVPFLTLVVLATQEPTVLARELLSDADCTRCLDVRRRADFLISELPVLSAISEVVTAQGTSVAMLSLDCAAKGGSSRLRILRTLCEKGSRVPVDEAANLLLRSVCEAGAGFKACSAVMNQHREAILDYLSNGLRSSSRRKQQQLQQAEVTHFCWPVCEGRLKYLDRIALLLVQWATQPEVYQLITTVRDIWGALAVLGVTACLLGTAIQLRASSSTRTAKIRIVVNASGAPGGVGGGGTSIPPSVVSGKERRQVAANTPQLAPPAAVASRQRR